MKIAGVVGFPVSHSLSPRLHTFWLKEMGIEGMYVPLTVSPDRFGSVVDALRCASFAGVNVTVPHKQAAFALAETNGAAARNAGAANLLVFRQGTIEGHNTDVEGLRTSLEEEFGADTITSKDVLVLGAGGAARAGILALDELGAREIRILNRNFERARSLAAEMCHVVHAPLIPQPWTAWNSAAAGVSLLINATNGGMMNAAPLHLSLDPLPPDAAVYDLVYNPDKTDLLRRAEASGRRAINGLGMLMHQAVPAFEAFYGVKPRVTAELRRALAQEIAR